MDTRIETTSVPGDLRRIAVIDIGTVTTRLLIADTDGVSLREVVRRTEVTHLGEGLHASGRLSVEGIERVFRAVASFVEEAERLKSETMLAVATSAARDASNAREFAERVEKAGVRPRIIPGTIEARLSFSGATYSIDDDDILVADLGGGSTELVFGCAHDGAAGREVEIDSARSLDVGSRRVLDMFLTSDPPSARELDAAAQWVADEMRPFFDGLRERPRTLITLAGTGTTLSAVLQELRVYDPERVHLSRLTGGDVADLRVRLAAMTVAERRNVVGMDPARADVIVAGALILETIMALAGVDSTVVSEHDILYGLVLAEARQTE